MTGDSERLEITDPRWIAFVETQSEATPFHHPRWSSLLTSSYGFRSFAFVNRDPSGEISAGIPVIEVGRRRRWISLAFTDYCGPLGEPDAIDALVRNLDTERGSRNLRSFEIRDALTVPYAGSETRVVGYRHEVTLPPDPATLFPLLHRSQVQRGIKRSERDGVSVRIGSARTDLVDLFYGLHLATRKRLGVPIQPRRFFEGLWDGLIEPGLGLVLVAEFDAKPAAAAVFLCWNHRMIYKFGASDDAFWRHRPNHAVFWRAITWGCENGFTSLDFGRTDVGNEGLRSFKAGWATTETPLPYTTFGASLQDRNSAAARALGVLIRHSPEVVCRQVGELLYRYAA